MKDPIDRETGALTFGNIRLVPKSETPGIKVSKNEPIIRGVIIDFRPRFFFEFKKHNLN